MRDVSRINLVMDHLICIRWFILSYLSWIMISEAVITDLHESWESDDNTHEIQKNKEVYELYAESVGVTRQDEELVSIA